MRFDLLIRQETAASQAASSRAQMPACLSLIQVPNQRVANFEDEPVQDRIGFDRVVLGGAAINFAVYALVIWFAPDHFIVSLLGIAARQVVAIFWKFFGARRFAVGRLMTK